MKTARLHVRGSAWSVGKVFNQRLMWDRVHEQHDGNDDELKQAFSQDRTALSVFAALLMTVDFAGLLLSPTSYNVNNTHNDEVSIFYFVCFGVAASCSLSAVLMGTMNYISINKYKGTSVREVVHFIEENTPFLLTVISLGDIAVWSTLFGAIAGVYLNQGTRVMISCAVPAGTILALSFYYGKVSLDGPPAHIYGSGESIQPIKVVEAVLAQETAPASLMHS